MPTSAPADSLQIRQYIENAQAILDSLTRYEFAKQKLASFQLRLEADMQQRQQLLASQLQVRGQLVTATRLQARYQARFQKANRERWIWRTLGTSAAAYWAWLQCKKLSFF